VGKKRLIEGKIVDDEKIGYTRICMLGAFLGLPGRRSGREGEPATETVDTEEEGKPTKETANTGLPGSETNPELLGVIDWTWLANEIEKIQKLVQQGELTWEEVYLLFEKIFNTLEAKLKTTREEAISGFQQSLGELRKKIVKISSNLSREVGKITSSMFKKPIMGIIGSIIALALVVNPITASSAYAKGGYYDNIHNDNVPAYVHNIDLSRYNYLFTNQLGVSNLSFPDADSVQTYDPPEGGPENGEGEEFNLEQALNLLKKHPTILNNTLLQIIDEINQQLLQEKDQQPSITGLKIVKDGNLIVELSGSTNFSKGVYEFDSKNRTFKLYAQTGNGRYEISHTGGVIVVNTPYILNGEEGVKQYTSGPFTLEGHCCGRSANFAVFELLHDSGGGSVEIHAGGEVYKFDIVAVGVFDAEESMDILSYDYEEIEEYFAKLLGLYDGENPQWKQKLSSENSENLKELNQLMESFLAGELIFLRTCDGDPNSLYVGSNGQLHSTRRVVAVAKLQTGQKPPGFMKPPVAFPIESVQGQGVTIRNENPEDWEKIRKLFENLLRKYPEIVEEALRAAIAEARRFEGPQLQNLGTDTNSNSNSNSENSIGHTPTPQPSIGGSSSSAVSQATPNSVDSNSPGQIKESQAEVTFAQKIKYLNEELSKAGLDEILPTIEFVGETDVIDLQALVRQIKSLNKDLPSLITHFLTNRHHLGLLGDYIQVLDQLAVGAPDGGYKQNLNDFACELRLAELAVRGLLLTGVVIISIIISIIVVLLFKNSRRQRQKSS